MIKFEIIANQALEASLMEIMPVRNGKPCYTMIHQVDGSGFSGWCMGNDVWPEENIMFILYTGNEQLEVLKEKLNMLRKRFPLLGLAAFEHSGITEV
jgi:hypothetical protein